MYSTATSLVEQLSVNCSYIYIVSPPQKGCHCKHSNEHTAHSTDDDDDDHDVISWKTPVTHAIMCNAHDMYMHVHASLHVQYFSRIIHVVRDEKLHSCSVVSSGQSSPRKPQGGVSGGASPSSVLQYTLTLRNCVTSYAIHFL